MADELRHPQGARRIWVLGALIAVVLGIGLTVANAVGPGSDRDAENALKMVDDQIQLVLESGATEQDETYQALVREREEILRSLGRIRTDPAAASRELGSAEAQPVVAGEAVCEAIPPFRGSYPDPARCLTLPRNSLGYLYVVLGEEERAIVFAFGPNGVPRLEEHSIPPLPELQSATIQVGDAEQILVNMKDREVVIDASVWGRSAP